MSIGQARLSIRSKKPEVRAQFAALCFQLSKKKPRILLVSTRGTGRWVLPKGWPINGKTPAQSALREAFEEAGVAGKPFEQCMGHYSYTKYIKIDQPVPCIVAVFPIEVDKLNEDFPELGQRKLVWLSPEKAAKRVSEPELKPILRDFDPRKLRPSKA